MRAQQDCRKLTVMERQAYCDVSSHGVRKLRILQYHCLKVKICCSTTKFGVIQEGSPLASFLLDVDFLLTFSGLVMKAYWWRQRDALLK